MVIKIEKIDIEDYYVETIKEIKNVKRITPYYNKHTKQMVLLYWLKNKKYSLLDSEIEYVNPHEHMEINEE